VRNSLYKVIVVTLDCNVSRVSFRRELLVLAMGPHLDRKLSKCSGIVRDALQSQA